MKEGRKEGERGIGRSVREKRGGKGRKGVMTDGKENEGGERTNGQTDETD